MMSDNKSFSDLITDNLETQLIGKRVLHFPRVTSTNDVAKQEAQSGAPEGTVVITDEQTAGKGRLKRTWVSPKGSILLSVILRPDISYLSSLTMLASLAVVHAIKKVTGLEAQIKWPNDVLIDGKKTCGILTESDVRGNTVAYAVVGIGINANLKVSDYSEIPALATSLSVESGGEVSEIDIIRCLLVDMERLYLALRNGQSLYEEWRDKMVTLGKKVQVKSGETLLEGIAESVAPDGSLQLRGWDGSLTKIIAGDVTTTAMNNT